MRSSARPWKLPPFSWKTSNSRLKSWNRAGATVQRPAPSSRHELVAVAASKETLTMEPNRAEAKIWESYRENLPVGAVGGAVGWPRWRWPLTCSWPSSSSSRGCVARPGAAIPLAVCLWCLSSSMSTDLLQFRIDHLQFKIDFLLFKIDLLLLWVQINVFHKCQLRGCKAHPSFSRQKFMQQDNRKGIYVK